MHKVFKKIENINFRSIISLKKNSTTRNILTVGFITLFIKLISFYKETYVASTFGLSQVLDTYFIAALVPGFIQNVFLGAFKGVFIPNYINELKTGKNAASFQTTAFIITIVIALSFILIAYLFTDTYLEIFFPNHNSEYYQMIKLQFYILAPCIFLWGISSLLSGLLNISSEFIFSSLPSALIPIATILSLIFLKDYFDYRILAFGTLAGSIFSFIILLYITYKKNILKLAKPDFKDTNVKIMLNQIPAKVSSGFLSGMNVVVDQYFAAQLIVGSITAINYGQKIPAFLIGLLVVAINSVLLPKFSKMFVENPRNAYVYYKKIIKLLFFASILFSTIGFILSDFLVELFYQRNEFTEDDTNIVSMIQKIFLIYVPFTICGMVIVNFLTSMNHNKVLAYVSFAALILNIILDYVLIEYYGIMGIAICTSIVIILKNIFTFLYTKKVGDRIIINS